MITWKETRSVISKTLGKEFKELGFKNPSYLMYRHREYFIDVFQCYYNNYDCFYIDLGCQPVGIEIKNNFKTYDTIFRGRIYINETKDFPVKILNSLEDQDKYLRSVAPHIIMNAITWFSNFTDINSAISALENNDFSNPLKNVFLSNKGSISYNNAMQKLLELKQN